MRLFFISFFLENLLLMHQNTTLRFFLYMRLYKYTASGQASLHIELQATKGYIETLSQKKRHGKNIKRLC